MTSIIGSAFGGILLPSTEKFHVFDPALDIYEYAEFSKDNGDFYQIVKREFGVYYKFQKENAIYNTKSEGEWWINEQTDNWKICSFDSFISKINDRINHSYNIDKLVLSINNINKLDYRNHTNQKFKDFCIKYIPF